MELVESQTVGDAQTVQWREEQTQDTDSEEWNRLQEHTAAEVLTENISHEESFYWKWKDPWVFPESYIISICIL